MSHAGDTPGVRRAGRVLAVDPADHLLLIQACDPGDRDRVFWFTPGGGVEPGESTREAAVREFREETGSLVSPDLLGEPVFSDEVAFVWNGVEFRQVNDYFAVRVARFEPAPTLTELEEECVLDYRWWHADQLRQSDELFYPDHLAGWLRTSLVASSSGGVWDTSSRLRGQRTLRTRLIQP